MNKKVLTLCAGFLLAGSLTAVAQYSPAQIDYRSRLVKSADLDATFQDVNKINQEYYYQLEVNPASVGWDKEKDAGRFVLTAERDYSTGKVYLTVMPINEAVLTHSLWKIKVVDRSVNGRVYTYENKETGFELTFDHTNALQINPDADGTTANPDVVIPTSYTADGKNNANVGWSYAENGLMDGCNDHWGWYTTEDNGASKLDYKKIYSYFHNGTDSVMALRAVKGSVGMDAVNNAVYAEPIVNGLSGATGGLQGSKTTGYAVVAVKDSKANAEDWLNKVDYALQIRPVVAGAKVLNAAEINSMIDADDSWLTFNDHIMTYGDNNGWQDGANSTRLGAFAKFTVLKTGTNEALNIVEKANPFIHAFKDGKFVAESSGYDILRRENYERNQKGLDDSHDGSLFAGYDILLRTSDPVEKVGNNEKYQYLFVNEHNYEGTPNGNYNGLKVGLQQYAYMTGELGTENAGRIYVLHKDASATAAGIHECPDALEARYHWKATYYATNDSLVLEPLNASRMNQDEMDDKEPFEQTHLATAWSHQWVNTINEAVAYDEGNEEKDGANIGTDLQGNSMYNKAAGVPVALYAMNNSQVGDTDWLLTVGSGSNKGVNASDSKWAAVCKDVDANQIADDNPAYVTNKEGGVYQAQMNLRLTFDNDYTYLTRATIDDGLYFMNLVNPGAATTQTEHRVDGAYIVEDMKGHVVYDVEENGQQDFTHMPATQWVVEQQPCLKGDEVNNNDNPVVKIWNREFNGLAAVNERPVFEGQLYTTGEGKMYTIDYRHYGFTPLMQTVDRHPRMNVNAYNAADTVKFNAVDPQTTLGYFNATEDELRNNVFKFQHMANMAVSNFLGVDENNQLQLDEEGLEFELFRSEGWMPVADDYTYYDAATGQWITIPNGGNTYHFEYVDSMAYGYPSVQANVQRLSKTFYKIKVKDDNNIDNDHLFVAIDNQHKYVIATEEEIKDADNHLTFAVVTLKENNCLNGTHGYAIVNAPAYVKVTDNATNLEDLKNLYKDVLTDEFGQSYDIYYVNTTNEDDWVPTENENEYVWAGYNPNKDVIMVEKVRSSEQVDGKLAVEAVSMNAKIDDLCATSTDAFALVSAENRLYRDLSDEYADLINNEKQVINIMGTDEQSNEFLFEDTQKGMNYLGIENKTALTSNEGFYVDKVAKSSKVMPQYLFAVAADSVPAYTYCNKDGHGNHGINPTCDHAVAYPGYVEGRFLINFNDSINDAMINKLHNADKYKSNGYTRLGFVEAVHRGDSLYVLTNGRTLESLKMAAEDGSGMYICPDSLAKEQEGKIYTIVTLDGKHNNAAFSLRNVGDADNTFMIESNDAPTGVKGYSQVGSFAGAWVKVLNGVPVLAQYKNANGNHNTGDYTDSWFAANDYFDAAETTGEFINQGARFTFEVLDKDASATANEEIAAGTVTVVATDGAVIVKGAEGKNVIVSTILGKVVANETINSDNETIAAPAGIVVVSVDGESFKVVVK